MQTFKAEMKSLLGTISKDVTEVKLQNKSIQDTFVAIQKANEDIKKSVEFMAQKYEEVKGKCLALERMRKDQDEKIQTLEQRVDDLERSTRLSKIEIRNIPMRLRETREDLVRAVGRISETVKSNLSLGEIRDIYRLTNKSNNATTSVVIAELSTPLLKNSLMKAIREYNLKNKPSTLSTSCLGNTGEPKPIYVSEHLTNKSKKLFYLAREFAKSERYRFAWTANGKVYIRQREGSDQILIKSENQLQLLKEASTASTI